MISFIWSWRKTEKTCRPNHRIRNGRTNGDLPLHFTPGIKPMQSWRVRICYENIFATSSRENIANDLRTVSPLFLPSWCIRLTFRWRIQVCQNVPSTRGKSQILRVIFFRFLKKFFACYQNPFHAVYSTFACCFSSFSSAHSGGKYCRKKSYHYSSFKSVIPLDRDEASILSMKEFLIFSRVLKMNLWTGHAHQRRIFSALYSVREAANRCEAKPSSNSLVHLPKRPKSFVRYSQQSHLARGNTTAKEQETTNSFIRLIAIIKS